MKAFWESLTANTAPVAIVSGTKSDYQHLHLEPQKELLQIPKGGIVLDFACGIGRNSYMLAQQHREVICYDLPNMIEIMKRTEAYAARPKNITVYDDWSLVKNMQFDAIICSLALQHIYEDELMGYLDDFVKMAKNLFVFGRSYNDDNKKLMMPLLETHYKFVDGFGKTKEEIDAMREEDHYMVWMERK